MVIFVLAFGVLTGTASAVLLVMSGYSVWLALVAYSLVGGVGSLTAAAGIYLLMINRTAEKKPLPTVTPFSKNLNRAI